MPVLVIKDPVRKLPAGLGGGMDIGWRVVKPSFTRDFMWGNCKDDEALGKLLTELRQKHPDMEVLDLRG